MATYRVSGIKDAYFTNSGGSDTDIPFVNSMSMTPEFETITYEGDGQQKNDYYGYRLTGTVGFDKLDTAVLELLYGKSEVTSGLPADEASRYYFGDDTELTPVELALTIDYKALNDADDSDETIRVMMFKVRVQPFAPPEGANAAKWAPYTFSFETELTTTDIEAAALPSVPSGGAHFAVIILS